jgi:pimeloyl-ACP methyl ester carboxylesterase
LAEYSECLLYSTQTKGYIKPDPVCRYSSNYSVTIFDNRGTGNTTTGTKQFTISQFAKDTASLLDALKISKADVLGWSLGSYIAQELTLTNPEQG